jgi:hypothetical protein
MNGNLLMPFVVNLSNHEWNPSVRASLMRNLTLLIRTPPWPDDPDNPGLPEGMAQAMPGLARLLSRGNALPPPTGATEACCQALGIPRQQDWPVAPSSARARGLPAQTGYWLRLDPVYMDVNMQGMFLRAVPDLGPQDASTLEACLGPVLDEQGMEAHFGTDGIIHVRLASPPALATTPLDEVAGRQPTRFLPRGTDAPRWTRLMHEIQMALHDPPLNLARQAAHGLPVNSYWVWGGGLMPEGHSLPTGVWGGPGPLAELARGLDVPVQPMPADIRALLAEDVKTAVCLLEELAPPSGSPDPDWGVLDARWFRPLSTALALGRLGRLRLLFTSGARPGSELDWAAAWRFWR